MVQDSSEAMLVNLLIPFLNEEENIFLLRTRICEASRGMTDQLSVIFVNDGSSDNSEMLLREWIAADPRIRLINFSRNFGSHAAVAAGLRYCDGDCAVIMAADLQDPPETIPQLVEEFRKGPDVVWACRTERIGESFFTRITSLLYYGAMRRLGLPNMPPTGADFLLVSKKVIKAINQHPEKHTSVFGMISWMGFEQSFIGYVKQARHAGVSKWNFSKKIKVFIDSIVSFSYVPIRLTTLFGLFLATAGFLYAIVVFFSRLAGLLHTGTGFAALMTVLLVGQGTILLMLGILGEYIWRAFDESRGRPRFIIDEVVDHDSLSNNSLLK
jgi:glycosyltransferase involved in cell wall biosynthesis